jgi:hypothetical protein
MSNNKRTIVFVTVAILVGGAAVVGTVQASGAAGTGGGASRITSTTVFAKARTDIPATVGVPEKDDGVVEKAEPFDPQSSDGFASGATASQ